MNLDAWLSTHPYLEPLAEFHASIESALENCSSIQAAVPELNNYLQDFHDGIPLLQSSRVTFNLEPAEEMLKCLINHLALASGNIAEECRTIQAELHHESDSSRRALKSLLEKSDFDSHCPSMLRYFGWTVLSRYLQPVVLAFAKWRDDEKWLRSYCPTCGSWAAMAQLLGVDQGKRRLLCCGRCRSRWQYRRTGCPFCQTEDDHRLKVLAVEGEGGLRVDYCEGCRGYLKTYDGEGNERVLLANWTSIHLDIFARDRQLNAFAEPIYQL